MQPIEIIVIIIAVTIVVSVAVWSFINKKNGKSSCGGDCSACGLCNNIKEKENVSKYLKCPKCGAIVKVIKPCNCKDCGIQCCGQQMVEIDPGKELSGDKVLTCEKCGAVVEVIKPCTCSNCGIQCCGEQMK